MGRGCFKPGWFGTTPPYLFMIRPSGKFVKGNVNDYNIFFETPNKSVFFPDRASGYTPPAV
jgi:hypothetical protein